MLQDFRHALRSLSSSPGFVAVTALCLALGIGVNVAMFAILNAALLTPPPFADAERLLMLGESLRGSPESFEPVSYPNYLDLKEAGQDVVEMAASRSGRVRIDEGRTDERHGAAFVTPGLLPLLGLGPLAGRAFVAGDDEPGAAPVVLLSEPFWQQRYGEDRSIIGRTIDVDGIAHTVVGIMPGLTHRSFRDARVWLPLTAAGGEAERDRRTLAVFVRLLPGATPESAAARLDTAAVALESRHAANEGRGVALQPMTRAFSAATRSMLAMGFGGVLFVLLIACANAANLTLARTLTRRREVAIRTALGATSFRIVRQSLSESLVLAALAAPLGVLLGSAALGALRRGLPAGGVDFGVSIDAPTLAFTVALVAVVSALFGLAPALQARRGEAREALGDTAHSVTASRRQKRLRDVLVVGEVALSLVLLIAASLLIRSFWTLLHEDTVLDPGPLATLQVELAEDRAAAAATLASRVHALIERAEGTPGVEAAAASDFVPLAGGGRRATLLFDDPSNGEIRTAAVQYGGVTGHFFDTLGLAMQRGRAFTDAEASTRSGVAIVNERLARQLWRDDDPLGKRIRIVDDADAEWLTVIGVAPTLPNWALSGVPRPTAYLPLPYVAVHDPLLIVRAAGDPLTIASAVRDTIEIDGDVVVELGSMTALHEDLFWRQALFGRSFVVLGAIALLLAAIGLYGLLSHLVVQRTHEIGLRVALGAARGDVVALVMSRGLLLVVAGVVIGCAGALGVTRVMRGLLYGVDPGDPLHFVAAALLLTAVGVAASGVPARRAAAADPMASLRH